jgi:hypothetical protein
VLGYGLRFGFLLFAADRFSPHFGDEHRYKREAENLLDSGTFAIEPGLGPTAFDGPIYACFLVPFMLPFDERVSATERVTREQLRPAVAIVQSIISLLTAWMIAQITWLITGRVWAARIALLSWCVYPFAVLYSVFLISETLYTAGLVASVLCAYLFARDLRVRSAVILGLVLGLTSLTRATVNVTIPFLFLAVLALRWDQHGQALKGLVLSGLTLVVVLSPWTVRNYVRFGRILPGSSQMGRMLYLANNPDNHTGGVLIPRDARPPEREPGENEIEWNERLGRLAKEFIRENPGRFLHLCGMRLYQFWRVTPMYEGFTSPMLLLVSVGSYLPLFVFALTGFVMLRGKLKRLLPLFAIVLSTYGLHVVFGVSLRYRFPIEPLMIPPAVYGLSCILRSIAGRDGPPATERSEPMLTRNEPRRTPSLDEATEKEIRRMATFSRAIRASQVEPGSRE